MLFNVSRYRSVLIVAVVTTCMSIRADTAPAQALYFEGFDDDVLQPNTMIVNSTIGDGILRLVDPLTARATFSVVENFNAEVLTYSFDVVEPIVETQDPTRMEVIIRAGIGTGHGTLQNADHVVEAIIFRDAPRAPYVNNGDETIFLVANNKASDVTYMSPIDGTPVTLTGFQYVPYILNNATNTFAQHKGIGGFNGGQRPLERFGIGSSTTGDVGTFAIDNVLVMPGATFERDIEVGPPPVLGDVDGSGIVDFADFEPIRANFRMMVDARTDGDLVRNGIVDFADFHQWKAAFVGAGGSLAGVDLGFLASVPEPGTLVLLLVGWAVMSGKARTQRLRFLLR